MDIHALDDIVRERLAGLVVAGIVAAALWLLAGRGLRGVRLALWCAVPVLGALAMVCTAGPGRLFSKSRWEGPILHTISRNHALTLLDLPGLAAGALAVGLAAVLVWSRRPRPDLRSSARTGGDTGTRPYRT